MDPISIALGVGSLANSVIQGNRAASLQRAIALRNLQMQEQAQFKQNSLANRMLAMQESGQTDARGNQTRYIPGVGWVTTPSDMTRKLTDASDREELRRATIDAALRRRGMQSNETRRGAEGARADATFNEWGQDDGYDENRLFNMIRQRNREGLARGYDDESRNAMRQAMRSNNSNAGSIIARLAERRAEGYRKADSQAKIDALTQSEGLKSGRDARLGNKYNMLASRATNYEDTPFQPNNLSNSLLATLTARNNTAPQAFGVAIGAAGNAPQMQQLPPNYTNSFALGGLSNLIGAMNLRKEDNAPTSLTPANSTYVNEEGLGSDNQGFGYNPY